MLPSGPARARARGEGFVEHVWKGEVGTFYLMLCVRKSSKLPLSASAQSTADRFGAGPSEILLEIKNNCENFNAWADLRSMHEQRSRIALYPK